MADTSPGASDTQCKAVLFGRRSEPGRQPFDIFRRTGSLARCEVRQRAVTRIYAVNGGGGIVTLIFDGRLSFAASPCMAAANVRVGQCASCLASSNCLPRAASAMR